MTSLNPSLRLALLQKAKGKKNIFQKGFTLVELMVVIVITSAVFMLIGGSVGRNKAFVLFFLWAVSVVVLSGGDTADAALTVLR